MFPRLTIDPPPRPKLACLFGFNRGRLTAGEVTCSTCDFISESVRRIRTPAFQAPSTNCADDLEPEPTESVTISTRRMSPTLACWAAC